MYFLIYITLRDSNSCFRFSYSPPDGDAMTGDASYPYLTSEDMRILPDDSLPVLEKPTGQIPVSVKSSPS